MKPTQFLQTRFGEMPRVSPALKRVASSYAGVLALTLAVAWLAGCAAPIGADRATTGQAYDQVEANALRTGKPSAHTVSILHRYKLDLIADDSPDQAVRELHQKAVATGERDLLFALAELSYVAAGQIDRSVTPWDKRDARDYYLGSAIYAWLFLFGESKDSRPPGAFDRRFREACDFYNYSLGLAFTGRKNTNGVVQLQSARRRLPVGEIEVRMAGDEFTSRVPDFEKLLLADQFRVRGLSVRNRDPGVGTPLICVEGLNKELGLRPAIPATLLLRGPATLGEITATNRGCSLELHSGFGNSTVAVGGQRVPLEMDLTTYRAYQLNQATVWKLGPLQFLVPAERIRNQLILHEPFDPNRIPIVFVHGTFSSPVTWAEMANTLTADPVLRNRYQAWSFIYGSGNPLVQSFADFRTALTEEINRADPAGTNKILRQMVIIGHSQGGLVTKSTVVDNGDRLWRLLSTNRFEDVKLSDKDRAEFQRLLFYKPLPFVSRVVFIATPHHGSYLSGSIARRFGQWLVSLPRDIADSGKLLMSLGEESEANKFLHGKIPTSLDGMSPKHPGLLAMAEIPVAPGVKAHSIVPVLGGADAREKGKDGVVEYQSAHVEYVESELIVDAAHTCLGDPAVIEEVRRILHLHLNELH